MESREWTLPAPSHWWQQSWLSPEPTVAPLLPEKGGKRGWARGDSRSGTCGCALMVRAALVMLSGRTLWCARNGHPRKRLYFNAGHFPGPSVHLVHWDLWWHCWGDAGAKIERKKRKLLTTASPRRNYSGSPYPQSFCSFPFSFFQAQLILLGNRRQSLTGSKRETCSGSYLSS